MLYKHSYLTLVGDWTFLFWVGLWLGRHFLLRLIFTVSWVYPPSIFSSSSTTFINNWSSLIRSKKKRPGNRLGGSWTRRRNFDTWLHRQKCTGRIRQGREDYDDYVDEEEQCNIGDYVVEHAIAAILGTMIGGSIAVNLEWATNVNSTVRFIWRLIPCLVASTVLYRYRHRLRYITRTFLSPYVILSTIINWMYYFAMAGQYCDASAANGIASLAMMEGWGGGLMMETDHHLLSSLNSGGGKGHHHGHNNNHHRHHSHHHHYPDLLLSLAGSSNLYASNGIGGGIAPHIAIIISLSRTWGTLCGLTFAFWSLLRGEGGGVRGAVGEFVWLAGGAVWGWIRSSLAFMGLSSSTTSSNSSSFHPSSKSQSDSWWMNGSTGSSDLTFENGKGGGGGGNKRNKGKKSSNNQSHNNGDSLSSNHRHSNSNGVTNNGIVEVDSSSEFVVGKLTFHLFPISIRTQALHIQQMRTSEMYRLLEWTWEACPPLQLLVFILTAIFLMYGWLFVLGGYAWILGNGHTTNDFFETVDNNIPNWEPNPNYSQHDGSNNHYWRTQSPFPAPPIFDVEPPSWVSLLFLVITFGTTSSLFLYGRIMLPIPEFVAGTNVLKAIREETRIIGGVAGSGTHKTSKLKEKDLPWAENYKSITTENRLRLYYKVAIVRILENIFLCAILPQTEIICRYTEHCEAGPVIWGPSGVTGISGRRFGNRYSLLTSSFDALVGDDFATRLIITSTVLVTAICLVAQMTLMNRTYLAIMGFISGEWELVTDTGDGDDDEISGSSSWPKRMIYEIFGIGSKPAQSLLTRRSSNTLMQWDPKRRYQKGDRIAYDDAVYEAVSNSPEGPPFDPFLRAAHEVFGDELGHPSSSNMMPCLSMGCLILAIMMLSSMVFWKNAGWNYFPLLLCFSSALIAGYAINHSTKRSIFGMKKIADEITEATKLS